MRKYIDMLGEAVPPVRTASGTADAMVFNPKSPLIDPNAAPITMKDLALSLVGGLGGVYLWRKHPVLGFIGGVAVGSSVTPMMRGYGTDRTDAAYRLGVVGAGVAASLAWHDHPALGYIGGAVAASALSAYVSGSPAYRLAARLDAEKQARAAAA